MTSNAEVIAPRVAFMGLIINRYRLNRQRFPPGGTSEPFPPFGSELRLFVSSSGRAVRRASRDSNRSLGRFRFFTAYLSWTNIQHTCEPVNQSQPCRVDSTYIGEKHAFRVRLNANF